MMLFQKPLAMCVLLIANLVAGIHLPLAIASQTGPSQCIQCHTNLKKLIRLCWKVEALKPKDSQSAQTSGEG